MLKLCGGGALPRGIQQPVHEVELSCLVRAKGHTDTSADTYITELNLSTD
jgi:hypothetical protein